MKCNTTQISDTIILNLIGENNLKGWKLLYDKYAEVMYGVICTHTADKSFAEEILISLFIQLKHQQILLKASVALYPTILRYTHANTKKELKKRGINYTESPNMKNSILHIFCSQYTSVKKVSKKLKVSEVEVKQHLQKEFFMLRTKKEASHPIQLQQRNNKHVLVYH